MPEPLQDVAGCNAGDVYQGMAYKGAAAEQRARRARHATAVGRTSPGSETQSRIHKSKLLRGLKPPIKFNKYFFRNTYNKWYYLR